jgi:hypothetical protein
MALPWLATGLAGGAGGRYLSETLTAWTSAPGSGQPARVDVWLLWLHYIALLGAALVAILVFYLFMRWWKKAGPDRLSASDQLSEFRTLYEQGQLAPEEFERLRTLLGERMKQEMEGQPSLPPAGINPSAPRLPRGEAGDGPPPPLEPPAPDTGPPR